MLLPGGEEGDEKLVLVLLLSAVPNQSIILTRELLAKKFTPHNTWRGAAVMAGVFIQVLPWILDINVIDKTQQ